MAEREEEATSYAPGTAPGPYLGEIRIAAWNYEPRGWLFCHGQALAISENPELFSLIGTLYGGDGQQTFNLPDLRGRVPLHHGPFHGVGMAGGLEEVTLTVNEMPAHTHPLLASALQGRAADPTGDIFARSSTPGVFRYADDTPDVSLMPQAVGAAGEQVPHDNMPPFVCLNYIIAVDGPYPPRP